MNNPFKSYDVRGIFNKDLLPEDVTRIGQCYAGIIKQKICIGYDCRTSSVPLCHSFASGFTSAGHDVVIIGLAPTPVCNYYGIRHQLDNVVITGSHTPPEYNGIKFFDKLGVVYNERLRKIEKEYLESSQKKRAEWDEAGKTEYDNSAILEYIDNIKEKLVISNPVRITLDCGNGTAGLAAPQLLEKLGCETIVLNKECDATFPNRSPEPTAANLAFLQKRVVETKSAFGCAFDGDADRSVFVDDKGRVLDGSVMTAIFAKSILEKNKNAYIVASIDMSSAVKEVVENAGGNLVCCTVGMKDISHELIDNKGMFAGEVSSHFYFNDFYPFSDGILSCAKLAKLLSEGDKKLSELADELPKYRIKHYKFASLNHEKKFESFRKIKEELSKEYGNNAADGIKIFLNKTDWALIRPSNTEPVIRMTIEAKTEEALKSYEETLSKKIEKFL